MREIKFRAWYLDQELMCSIDGFDFPNKEMTVYHHGFWNGQETCSIEDLPIMQYTGIKDKYEKEIYEGDIVSIQVHDRLNWNSITGKVVFLEGGWTVEDVGNFAIALWSEVNEVEVIGNIYQNAELLVGD